MPSTINRPVYHEGISLLVNPAIGMKRGKASYLGPQNGKANPLPRITNWSSDISGRCAGTAHTLGVLIVGLVVLKVVLYVYNILPISAR